MKRILLCALLGAAMNLFAQQKSDWETNVSAGFKIHFTDADKDKVGEWQSNVSESARSITAFFKSDFVKPFDVFVFPHRAQLDAQWQKDWGVPDFKSECWMVASGVAHRLDLLSPNVWSTEACEHNASDQTEIQQLITHETVHVFHGQYNPVPDFTGLDDLAWLIEGVATYASGQLDEKRMAGVKKLVLENRNPTTLAKFWSGKDKYGLAGSLVKFVDQRIGRKRLFELLKETNQDVILSKLGLTESQLIEEWKSFVKE